MRFLQILIECYQTLRIIALKGRRLSGPIIIALVLALKYNDRLFRYMPEHNLPVIAAIRQCLRKIT